MKTVKEWFAQLPEPYKTQCLEAALYYDAIDDMRESLAIAIAMSIVSWPGLDIEDLIKRANSGEFDGPAIPWPEEAKWENAPEWATCRCAERNGVCWFYGMKTNDKSFYTEWARAGYISDSDMSGIDWTKTLEYRPR